MNKNKGITLIALVITIIVMLILVTVTIRVATDGNLFTHAANAASRTKIAAAEENELSSGNIGGKSIEEIVAEQTTETPAATTINFTISGTPYTAAEGTTWAEWVDGETFVIEDQRVLMGSTEIQRNQNGEGMKPNWVTVSPTDVIYGEEEYRLAS